MRSNLGRNVLLGLIAFTAGLLLQCMTEPEIIGDSGVVDQFLVDLGIKDQLVPDKKSIVADMLKDGIGPKADASDGGSGHMADTEYAATGNSTSAIAKTKMTKYKSSVCFLTEHFLNDPQGISIKTGGCTIKQDGTDWVLEADWPATNTNYTTVWIRCKARCIPR